jgi:hypothetical protein
VAGWASLKGALIIVLDTLAAVFVKDEAKEGWAFKVAALWVVLTTALVSVVFRAWWAVHVVAELLVAHT